MFKKSTGNKDVPVTFRLSTKEFEPYKKIIDTGAIKKSALFREMAVSKNHVINISGAKTKDSKRMIFLASKVSNNINQIAKKLNNSYRSGVVNEKTYIEILNKLVSVENAYIKAMDKC